MALTKNIPTDFPPKNHASSTTTYGVGTASNYGHVKISDSGEAALGVTKITATSINLDSYTTTGIYTDIQQVTGSTPNGYTNPNIKNATLIVLNNTTHIKQYFTAEYPSKIWFRSQRSGSWYGWNEIIDSYTTQTIIGYKTFLVPPYMTQLSNNGTNILNVPNKAGTLATTTDITNSPTINTPTLSTPVISGDISGTNNIVTLAGAQTLTNKILTSPAIQYPNFTHFNTTTTWSSTTYLTDTGIRYDLGKLHIYINATTHPSNRGGDASYKNWFNLGIAPRQRVPIFIQSETYHGVKGMRAYANTNNGFCYVWDEIGVTSGQFVHIFAIWVDP